MARKAPGRHRRKTIDFPKLVEMFPDEEAASKWFEAIVWADGVRKCPRCGGTNTHEATHKTMPYRCRPCRRFFSVRTGTVLQNSNLPLTKWVWAIYLEITNLKGVSSMKLHRDLNVSQKTAWHMLHRIRESFAPALSELFEGGVEVDESYFGGREKNKHPHKKANLGRGPVGKTAVVGAKDRETNRIVAQVVEKTDADTLQNFVMDHVLFGTPLYTDENRSYMGLDYIYDHETVKHSVSQFVNGQAHINGMESFWAGLKRAYHGVFHHVSPKHLQRYINQFAGKHNFRSMNTIDQMKHVVAGMVGKQLLYRKLTG